MANIPSLLDMLKAGVHFGHQANKWHPKMAPFIFGERNGVHIINLEKTQEMLAPALEFIKEAASQNKTFLFIGTKEQAKPLVKKHAEMAGVSYVSERWLGGLLTNFAEIQIMLRKYRKLKTQRDTNDLGKYTKKEQTHILKELAKQEKYLTGIEKLERKPDVVFIIDLKTEKTAFREAIKTNTPIIALCDTNISPDGVTYPIPSNDDATHTIDLMLQLMAEAVNEGKAVAVAEKAKNHPEENKPKIRAVAGGKSTFVSE